MTKVRMNHKPYEKKKKQNKTKDETPCCSKTGQEWSLDPNSIVPRGHSTRTSCLCTLLFSTLAKEILSNEDLVLLHFQNLMVTLSKFFPNILQLGMSYERKGSTWCSNWVYFSNHLVILDNLNRKFCSRSNIVVWRTINLITQFQIFYM